MENNIISDTIKYFEELAKLHQDIADFCFFDTKVLEQKNAQGFLKLPVLVMDSLSGAAIGFEDNFLEKITTGYIVLFKVNPEDYSEELRVVDESYRIGMQIFRRICADALYGIFIQEIDLKSLKWEPFGPMIDNFFGTRFSFDIIPAVGNINDDVWLHPDELEKE